MPRPQSARVASIRVNLDGAPLDLPASASVGAALIAVGVRRLRRSPRLGLPRGTFCLMGICQECLIVVDGEVVQACMTPVAEGMMLERLG